MASPNKSLQCKSAQEAVNRKHWGLAMVSYY